MIKYNSNYMNYNEFKNFLELMYNNYLENSENWENNNLESFLEALIAITDDLDGFLIHNERKYNKNNPSWLTFADILSTAIIYE